jgi:hypothetical protein
VLYFLRIIYNEVMSRNISVAVTYLAVFLAN